MMLRLSTKLFSVLFVTSTICCAHVQAQQAAKPQQLRPAALNQLQPASPSRLIPFSPTTASDQVPQKTDYDDGVRAQPDPNAALQLMRDPFAARELDKDADIQPQRQRRQPTANPTMLPSSGEPAAPVRGFNSDAGATEATGSTPPPALPQRPPIPTPPAMTLLPPRNSVHREPLSWRARAYELMSSIRGGKYNGVRLTRDFPAKPDETFAALAQACDSMSLHIESLSAPAHQLALRCNAQDRVVVVLVADSSTTGKTTVVAGLLPDSKSFKTDVIDDLLDKAQAILTNKGLL